MSEFKTGKINKHVLYSNILNRDVTLSIYLPESYNQLVKYNVILCFDGLDFLRFGRIQRTYESLIKEARIDDAIIVGFHYEDVDKRREEFHPQGSRSHLTIQSVGKEILPFIDSTFSTLKVGNARLLVGDSLAGSIALLTALTYPTIFSRVAMLSPHSDEKVLDKITLSIEKGKMLALVGPSGGGKTTFCNLIPRFYDVDKGDIKIDGKSIYDIKLDSLRKNIGVVQQEVFLYTGTIKENIKYGKQDASDEEVIEAAKKANIHEFIMGLKDGYDTYIGERGIKLSGGQKQRISIARVFLKNPPILILDEATSALDNVTEYLIQKSLEDLCKNRTTIVVAHRLSTIKNADEIIVLTDKGIEERGSHTDLIEKGGIYTELNRYSKIN